MKIVKQIA